MNRPRAHGHVALLAATALALAVAACGSDSSSSGGSTAAGGVQLVKDGALTVCTHLSYKPFQFKDSSGKVVGFDVDLADLTAKKLGATTTIVDIDFASMTSGAVFAAKKCDIAMGAITITDKRRQTVQFSDNYFSASQALLTKKDSGVADLPDLKGKKLGVQTDTTGQIYGEKQKAANGYQTVVFDDLPTQLTGLQSGRVQAIVNDNGPLLDFVKSNPTFAVVKEFDTGEQYGFMVKKDDANATKLVEVFNAELRRSVADGTYATMYKKWFGSEPTVLPSPSSSS
ncbi:MAG TPA: transporter substrate-binding domain-containing protein [Dermatophilaceae bacterium]|nr:transporter substrate-binding domain-containing protein [Dermatophilaceae bacterium]